MIDEEVRERFLREIAAQVPADRIAELHLFRPLRRGGTETGVAVIAVEQDAPPVEAAEAPVANPPDESGAGAYAAARVEDSSDTGDIGGPESAPGIEGAAHFESAEDSVRAATTEDADEGPYAADPVDVDAMVDDDATTADDVASWSSETRGADVELRGEPVADADLIADDAGARAESDAGLESDVAETVDAGSARGYADVAGDDDAADRSTDEFTVDSDASDRRLEASESETDIPVAAASAVTGTADVSLARPPRQRMVRHTVFTARYRLTRKGVDRGKWEFEVVADADAPLGTVDMVVRGVQRRAGDDEEPERLTAEGVRAALDGQAWQRTR